MFRDALWVDFGTVANCADKRHKEVERILMAAAGAAMAGDAVALGRFRKMAAKHHAQEDGDGYGMTLEDDAPLVSAQDAAWAIDFVATAAYRLECSDPRVRERYLADRGPKGIGDRLPSLVRRLTW